MCVLLSSHCCRVLALQQHKQQHGESGGGGAGPSGAAGGAAGAAPGGTPGGGAAAAAGQDTMGLMTENVDNGILFRWVRVRLRQMCWLDGARTGTNMTGTPIACMKQCMLGGQGRGGARQRHEHVTRVRACMPTWCA